MEASLGCRKHQREKCKVDDDLVCPVEETGVHNRLLTRPTCKRAQPVLSGDDCELRFPLRDKVDDDLVCPVEETGVHNRLLTRPSVLACKSGLSGDDCEL